MRIVLVGQGPFGEKTLDALIQQGEDIVGVFCPKGKAGDAMKALAESSSIALFQPEHMRLFKLQFCCVLDGNDSFAAGYKSRGDV